MIDAPEVFELSVGEKQSAVWRKLLVQFNEKLAALRARNDAPQDEFATATIRGQIAAYKALIALDEDTPVIE